MNLNYTAFFLISFIPLLIGFLWYRPGSSMTKWADIQGLTFRMTWYKILLMLVLSFTLVYGYINLIIHQMGFYELFFTDIMQGNETSKRVVEEFLAQYGQKHRHFGHGIFHGAINAFVFALPFICFHALLDNKNRKYVAVHFGYWLITSMIIGGLISEFV